jgi:hypothetical protein
MQNFNGMKNKAEKKRLPKATGKRAKGSGQKKHLAKMSAILLENLVEGHSLREKGVLPGEEDPETNHPV